MCVVAAHARSSIFGLPLLDSGMAVKTFFMISGFYMTLILTSKYKASKGGGYWLFISNRFLRIYPSYFVVLGGSLLFLAAASIKMHKPVDRLHIWAEAWQGHHYLGVALVALSQISIFGMDVLTLFSVSPSHGFGLGLTWSDLSQGAWKMSILRQSWSISVELFFYLIAPVVCVASRRVQVGLVLGSVAAYLAAWHWLPERLAWNLTYSFFPFQIGYLVLGVLSFHLLNPLFAGGRVSAAWLWSILAPFAGILLFWGWMPAWLGNTACIGLAFFAIPALFNLTGRIKVDRIIGDLSYPMYLSHLPCKWLMLALMGVTSSDSAIVPAWALLLITTAAAGALVWLVDYPVDRWRQRRVAGRSAAIAASRPAPAPALFEPSTVTP
jgi:peptidoglycan/LPS O-acetylase OafA/YrhL